MLIGALVAGLILGLLAGGSFDNLSRVRLQMVWILFAGFLLRYATELAIDLGYAPADELRLPLYTAGFALLLAGLWRNRDQPGVPLAFVGILLNATAMIVNGGYMPVWSPAIAAAGLLPSDTNTAFHVLVTPAATGGITAEFLLRLIPLGDIVPIPVPGLRNVASVGDFFLAGGLAFFLFATTVQAPMEVEDAARAAIRRRLSTLGAAPTIGYESYEPETLGAAMGQALVGGSIVGDALPRSVEAFAPVAEPPPLEAPPGIGPSWVLEAPPAVEAPAVETADAPTVEPPRKGKRKKGRAAAGAPGEGALEEGAPANGSVAEPARADAGLAASMPSAIAMPSIAAPPIDMPLVDLGALDATFDAAAESPAAAIPSIGVPSILARLRSHPYVRLALDSSFSALWTGQLISLVGDRINQVALAFLILRGTNSAIDVGLVFLVATLPNLLFGPIAGTLVDRWDHREVMIVSDLLRAGVVMLIPIAAVTNLALVYPLVFLVTTISIFFRPAKGAILPRMVAADDLIPANSALWMGENFADIGGYVIAGLFVALLGSQLPLAFWVDAVTYVASALLIASITVVPLVRMAARPARDGEIGTPAADLSEDVPGLEGEQVPVRRKRRRQWAFVRETREGWRFLRSEPVLLANTLQATVGQFMLGIFLALTPIYADQVIDRQGFDGTAAYSFMEGAIGAGNLLGGFVIGLIGARLALGRLVILGYVVTGAAVALLAVSGNLTLAIGLSFGAGVGNLAFVIPSQTLIQRRTPPELMGRVLGLRFSLVFGSMTVAMGVGGVLGQAFGVAPVIGVFGVVTILAGLAGLLVPAVRDA